MLLHILVTLMLTALFIFISAHVKYQRLAPSTINLDRMIICICLSHILAAIILNNVIALTARYVFLLVVITVYRNWTYAIFKYEAKEREKNKD
jgi:hypothetical protein